MVYKTRINPPWLKSFVKSKFDLRCYYHPKHHCMRYCKDCMEEAAFCDYCDGSSCKDHQGHTIIRVYKSSRKIGVCMTDINKLWKISKIAHYKINELRIVYLCSRKVAGVHKTKPSAHKCRICRYEIDSGYKYCSIACKMEGESRKGQVCFLDQQQLEGAYEDYNAVLDQQLPEAARDNNNDLPDQEQPEGGADKENKWPVGSLRKRSRKGIPMRSPLF